MLTDTVLLHGRRFKRLEIPPLNGDAFFNAFNGSIVHGPEHGEYLVAFRYSNFSPTPEGVFPDLPVFESRVGLLHLDSKLGLRRPPYILRALAPCTGAGASERFSGYEDPRIFRYNGAYYLLCTRICAHRGMNEMFLVRMNDRLAVEQVTRLQSAFGTRPEKNWVSLPHRDALYIKYSIDPNVLLKVTPETGAVSVDYSEPGTLPDMNFAFDFFLSGGSGLIPYSGTEYLGVAHISHFAPVATADRHPGHGTPVPMLTSAELRRRFNTDRMRHYYSVFYTASAQHPFALERMSPPVKFTADGSRYEEVQFAAGLCYTRDADGVLVTYGANDRDLDIIEVPRSTLESLLTPAASRPHLRAGQNNSQGM